MQGLLRCPWSQFSAHERVQEICRAHNIPCSDWKLYRWLTLERDSLPARANHSSACTGPVVHRYHRLRAAIEVSNMSFLCAICPRFIATLQSNVD